MASKCVWPKKAWKKTGGIGGDAELLNGLCLNWRACGWADLMVGIYCSQQLDQVQLPTS